MTPDAAELDVLDPLAKFADEFYKPPNTIYLDGNSLGLLCKPAEAALKEAIESWRTRAILGWTDGPEPWFEMSRKVSALLAPILGAEADDVMVGGSTTVNLHQLLSTFHQTGKRILIDEWGFPSDRYAVESHLRLRGQDPSKDLVVVNRRDDLIIEDNVINAMDGSVGLAVLPSVDFRTGQLLDLPGLTRRARGKGVMVFWDCSHSAGVVDHRFWAYDIDFAFGCTYKYLNGGPGSPGWLYIHGRFRDRLPGLAGWFGCDPSRQFEMSNTFLAAEDAGRFQISTPHVFSLAPLLGSLPMIQEAQTPVIRDKSLAMTWMMRMLIGHKLGLEDRFEIEIVTPTEDIFRGGHLTLRHPQAGKISKALRARSIIPDFRPPDLLRLAPSPLYTSFAECVEAVCILEDILSQGAHEQLPDTNVPVT